MDDRSALIEDYEMTIESMRREIMLLTGRLEEPIETSQTQKEFARLENALEIYRQDIEGNTADLFEGKKKLFELKAEEEWVKVSSPEFQECKQLNEKISQMNKKILNFKKETLEASTNLGIEQIKETNPNLYAHVKRAFKVEQKNIKLKEEQLKLKEERKQLRLEYFKITQAFAAEEKLKQKLKETEILVEAKEKNVNELTSKLSDFQEKNYVMKQNIQNVEVKKLFFNYNEICAKKEHLRNIKIELAKEIEQVQEILLKTSKHPEKITPTAANTNLRKEIRMLEMEVMEASKRIKELEQDHLQAQFAYEESKRTLRDLMKPVITPIYIPRTSLSRRSTLKDGMSPVSPGKKSVTIADYPHSAIIYEVGASIKAESPTSTKRASILKSIQPESPGSPQKRASILQILGKGMTETLTEQLSKALKGVGKPGSSISAKLLAMNRGALIGK